MGTQPSPSTPLDPATPLDAERGPRIPALLWLWSAPALVVAQVATRAYDYDVYRRWMRDETGVVENLTEVFLLGAIACAIQCYRLRRRVRWRSFGAAALVVTAGLVFFAGEEVSWGQHVFGFAPPEAIASRNEQHEFNIHNDPLLERVLDQTPRAALTAVAVAALVIALARRVRRVSGTRDFASTRPLAWAWPPIECVPATLVAITVSLPKKVFGLLDRPLPDALVISPGETKECCLALFLLVYLLTLALALRRAPPLSVAEG